VSLVLNAVQHLAAHHLSFGALGSSLLAYLDPGSGSYLLQLLIAAVLGGLLLLRVYWSKVKAFVRRLFTGRDEDLDVDE
jgi:hypothetical protein